MFIKGRNPKIVCLDTETTGLTPGKDEVLELAIVNEDGNTLFHSLIKPIRNDLWIESEKIHGILPSMVFNQKPMSYYKPQIEDILSSCDCIVGYNVLYDLRMLRGDGIQNKTPYWDVMPIFAELIDAPIMPDGHHKFQKLTKAASHFGYHWTDKAHGALADALATLFVAKKISEIQHSLFASY